MNINVGIVDQQVRGIASRLHDQLALALGKQAIDERLARSAAFVLLCAKTMLDLTDEEALDCLTEGGNDFGVDAIDVSAIQDGEFTVTLFQGKYKHENLEGTSNFEEGGVTKAVQAVRALFNPQAPVDINPRLRARIEAIRSLIVDGMIPRVRYLLCNNGLSWKKPEAQAIIDREHFPDDRVKFEHVNHDVLIRLLQSTQPVKDQIQFSGKALVEDFNFSRVFVGKVAVNELARLMETHGDRLLERNIRRFLGLQGNRVNEGIKATLVDPAERQNFFFFNNGVTLICQRFDYNALQNADFKVRVEGLQIINGGQTCRTIHSTISELASQENLEAAYVLVRLYQVGTGDDASHLVRMITYATNSQNPVDLRDLRSNDPIQKSLETSIRDLGYEYRRQRGESTTRPTDITIATTAEAVLSVWRRQPHRAKYLAGEHFGKLYEEIFSSALNGAQAVIAVLLFRIAENKRKRPPDGSPDFVAYASCFAAMVMGELLLADLGVESVKNLSKLDHRNFEAARLLVEEKGEEYFSVAVERIDGALTELYGNSHVTLQRLAATFRRGDLINYLHPDGFKGGLWASLDSKNAAEPIR